MRFVLTIAVAVWLVVSVVFAPATAASQKGKAPVHTGVAFETSDNCMACHNGLTTPAGEDVSIGLAWRASMMANSSRDPYWQASVRRETIDHPSMSKAIEDECAICHMPMSRNAAHAAGREGEIFRLLPSLRGRTGEDRLAADGVSCSLCHQIGPERLGTRESFVGGFLISAPLAGTRRVFGPYEVTHGLTALMRSSVGAEPAEAEHLTQSEFCATCHTLITQALAPDGTVVGSIPEQVPYLEWRHSSFAKERSCQACHMPEATATPIASVLGEPRERLGRHTFLGGNFFMLQMLKRYRAELGVAATERELDRAAQGTLRQLQDDTALVSIEQVNVVNGRLEADVQVKNLTGHKLPTGYPSRRVWLHTSVRDGQGRVIFESGAVTETGLIRGNDGDLDALRFEPHHDEIRRPDEVQIYESVMADAAGAVTTGLLRATAFVKDNRLLPRGFDKSTADVDIAVHGAASQDASFTAEGDRVRYAIDVARAQAPFQVDVELMFQPIGYRWADNLRRYDAPESRRFVGFFDSMAGSSSTVLARSTAWAR